MRGNRSTAKAPTNGRRRSTGARAMFALGVAALLSLLSATGAQAGYHHTGELTTDNYTSSVAVNQTSHDLYAASSGTHLGEQHGSLRRFDGEGNEIACSIGAAYPNTVAVNPLNGNLFVYDLGATVATEFVRTYGEECGSELGSPFAVDIRESRPVPQFATDEAGNLYVPNGTAGTLQKFEEDGTEVALASPISELFRPDDAAVDSAGNIYVVSGISNCGTFAGGKLTRYDSEGENEETLFEGEVTSVAIDRGTGDLFVGRGCGESFHIERYDSGLNKTADFGAGVFEKPVSLRNLNHIAVDEGNGTVYVADAGNERVQLFEFSPPEPVTLTVEPPAVGNVLSKDGKINCGKGVKCSAEYLEEEVVELEAAQPSGTHFTGWTGCEPPDGEASGRFCTLTMNADHTLGASYTSTHTLTVAKTGNPEAGGNVYSSPFGINCGNGSSCEAAFANETVVTLTAAVPAGSSFAGWKGPDAEAAGCGAATTCEVTMSEDLSLEAEYQKRYWLEVEVTSGGGPVGNVRSEPSALNCGKGSTCKVYFDAGTPVTLIASQGPGSHFESWTGCTPVGGQPRKCTLEMNENHEVTAAYE
jgi:DNA-binding beta-propeller fold protein YncE